MNYYVEDHENGPLRANGQGGPPRTDKQPLLMVAAPLSHGSNPNSNMAGRRREDDENLVAHALTSEGHDASEDGTGRGTPMTANGTGVRRLIPRECERLQALPDDWTAYGPDSRRYAALGDAVTSSVAEWIGRRIISANRRVAA